MIISANILLKDCISAFYKFPCGYATKVIAINMGFTLVSFRFVGGLLNMLPTAANLHCWHIQSIDKCNCVTLPDQLRLIFSMAAQWHYLSRGTPMVTIKSHIFWSPSWWHFCKLSLKIIYVYAPFIDVNNWSFAYRFILIIGTMLSM